MPTDVQPFALLFSMISLAIMATNGRAVLNRLSIPLLLALLLATLGFFLGTPMSERDLFYDARAIYGYISSVVIFTVFFNYIRTVSSCAVCRLADITMLITFVGFALNVTGQTWIIQLVVARAVFDFYSDQGRGLTSFFPEQSRLANQMILLVAVYYASSRLTAWRLCCTVLIAAASASGQFFINFSVLVASFIVSSMLAVNLSTQAKTRVYASASIIVLFSSFFIYHVLYFADDLVAMGFPLRGIYAFREVLNLDLYSLGSDYGFLFKISGPIQGYAATRVAPVSLELGANFYFAANPDFVHVYERTLKDLFQAPRAPYPERAYSIFGAWVTDLKLFGVLLTGQFFLTLKRSAARATGRERVAIRALVLATVFLFMTRSNTSDPTFWATAAAVFATADARRKYRVSLAQQTIRFSNRFDTEHASISQRAA